MLITDVFGIKQSIQSDLIMHCPNRTRQVVVNSFFFFFELSALIVSRHSFTVNPTVYWHHPRPCFWHGLDPIPLLNRVLATELSACSVRHRTPPCSEQNTTSAQANKRSQAVKLPGPPPLFVYCHKGPEINAGYRCTWHQPFISTMTQSYLLPQQHPTLWCWKRSKYSFVKLLYVLATHN